MKLVILNNKVHATHFDEQTIEGKYQDCTFLLVPDGKYTVEHTDTVIDGTEVRTVTSIGSLRCGDPAPTLDAEDTLANVRYQRSLAYPALGDVIDAMCKAEDGDRTELDAIIEARKQVKLNNPKPV